MTTAARKATSSHGKSSAVGNTEVMSVVLAKGRLSSEPAWRVTSQPASGVISTYHRGIVATETKIPRGSTNAATATAETMRHTA